VKWAAIDTVASQHNETCTAWNGPTMVRLLLKMLLDSKKCPQHQ